MLGEIGHISLIITLVIAIAQVIVALCGLIRRNTAMMLTAQTGAYLQSILMFTCFFALMGCFILSDFSVVNVAENSHTSKPLLYKISGTWASHEGSLILWGLILTTFGAAVAFQGRKLPLNFLTRTLIVHAGITIGFISFTLFTSNPFLRVFPIPLNGQGLNPLLQDLGLAFHPPLLYIGYVGFSVAFSFAVAALWQGKVGHEWARWVRPWVLVSWIFLSVGIMIGALWAYYELGWGGWWFWDPVENASLLPWFTGTALLHSVIVVQKRNALKIWTVLLAILTFSLSLLGTFLVRSGILTSVHSFALNPDRGIYILVYLIAMTGGALILYMTRAHTLHSPTKLAPLSRESLLVVNNAFLVAAAGVVLIGTLYPLLLEITTGAKITVGAPYFNKTVLPLLAPLACLLVIAMTLPWKSGKWENIQEPFVTSILFAGLCFISLLGIFGIHRILSSLGISIGVLIVLGSFLDWSKRVRFKKNNIKQALRRSIHLPSGAWGVILAHMGVGIMIIGIAASEGGQLSYVGKVTLNQRINLGEFTFTITDLETVEGANFKELKAHVTIEGVDKWSKHVTPSIRHYHPSDVSTTEAIIERLWNGHIHIAVGDLELESQTIGLRVQIKPLMSLLWWGGLIMVAGGLFSLYDRRMRLGLPRRRPQDPASTLENIT